MGEGTEKKKKKESKKEEENGHKKKTRESSSSTHKETPSPMSPKPDEPSVEATSNPLLPIDLKGLADKDLKDVDLLRLLKKKRTVLLTVLTIYIARVDDIRDMPVLDARTANGVQGTDVTIAYGGLSILSAEPFYNLHSFKLPSCPFTSILFSSSGYDTRLNEYSLMRIPTFDYGPSSFLSVSSPIVTLYTQTDSIFASFNYTLDKENRFGHHSLPIKSVVAITSPSWINSTHSFPYEFPITPFLNNSYTFAQKKTLTIIVTASDFLPNEKVLVQAGTQDDNTFESWTIESDQKTALLSFGSTVKVTVTTAFPNHSPRFLVQITSGSSGFYATLFIITAIHYASK